MIWMYWIDLNFLDLPNIRVDLLKINWIPERMYLTKLKEDWTELETIENTAFFNYYDKEKRIRYLEILENEILDDEFYRDVIHFTL